MVSYLDAQNKVGNLPSRITVNLGLAMGIGCWCLLISSCAPLVSNTPLNKLNAEKHAALTASTSDVPALLASDGSLTNDRAMFSARGEGAVSGLEFEPDSIVPLSFEAAPAVLVDDGPPSTSFVLHNDRANIQEFFGSMDVSASDIRQTKVAPAIFFEALPWNLKPMRDIQGRKDLYLSIMLPLALKVNRAIMDERVALVQSGYTGAVRDHSDPWLLELAAKYYELDGTVGELLKKVAPLPVDMIIAQSIEESGWGTSRFALNGHALFGQRVFNENAHGFVPKRREEGLEFKVQGFDSLVHSIETYALNLNRHRAYSKMRAKRASLMAADRRVSGLDLMPLLQAYSTERGKYIANIKTLIKVNKLQDFNDARLETHRELLVLFDQSSEVMMSQVVQAQQAT